MMEVVNLSGKVSVVNDNLIRCVRLKQSCEGNFDYLATVDYRLQRELSIS